MLNAFRDRQCGDERKHGSILRFDLRPEQKGHENAGSRRGLKASAPSASAALLLSGNDKRTVWRISLAQTFSLCVGRIRHIEITDLRTDPLCLSYADKLVFA